MAPLRFWNAIIARLKRLTNTDPHSADRPKEDLHEALVAFIATLNLQQRRDFGRLMGRIQDRL